MKKSLIRFLVSLTAAVTVASSLTMPVAATKVHWASGTWKRNSTGWWYEYGDGSYAVSEWKNIDGEQYVFNDKGYMHTGWLDEDGKRYYFGADGAMKHGWVTISADYQCFFSNEYISLGQLHSEWRRKKDGWHCYIDGKECRGWVEVGFKWYYLNKNGVMLTGWQQIDGDWYYLKPDGMMQSHWFLYKGDWYYLGPDGAMRTGWARVGNQKYGNWGYFGNDGVMRDGWLELNNERYYIDPETGTRIQSREHVIDGKTYYFDDEGHLLRNGSYGRDNYRAYAGADGVVTKEFCYSAIDFKAPKGWTRLPDTLPSGSVLNRSILVTREGEESSGSARPGRIRISISVSPDETDAGKTFDAFWNEHKESILNNTKAGHTDPLGITAAKRTDLGPEVMRIELHSGDLPGTMAADEGYVIEYYIRDRDVEVSLQAKCLPEQYEELDKALEQIAKSLKIVR